MYYKRAEEIRKTYLDAMKPQIDALESEKSALRKSIPTEVSLSILVNGTGLDTRDTTSASKLSAIPNRPKCFWPEWIVRP